MTKVFFSVTMSLDGFIAPDSQDTQTWWRKWMDLQGWVFEQAFFRSNLGLGDGGETGKDNEILEGTYARTGVSIMGKRMFDAGERGWPEEAPFHTPVFVLTHQEREPWHRPGGTTFYFVNDGIEAALVRAHEVADGRDIRIAGGGTTILQYLNAGLVDEFSIALTPVVFGSGVSLLDGIDAERIGLELMSAEPTPHVVHLRYRVVDKRAAAA